MNQLQFFYQLCMFKETPDKSPYSVGLLIVSLLLSIALGFWVVIGLNYYAPLLNLLLLSPFVMTLFSAIAITPTLIATYTTGVVYVSGYKNRLVQSLTCVLMSICILYLLLFVLLYFIQLIAVNLIDFSPMTSLKLLGGVVFIVITILLWILSIVKFIYQHAIGPQKAYAAISVWVLIEILVAMFLPEILYSLLH